MEPFRFALLPCTFSSSIVDVSVPDFSPNVSSEPMRTCELLTIPRAEGLRGDDVLELLWEERPNRIGREEEALEEKMLLRRVLTRSFQPSVKSGPRVGRQAAMIERVISSVP